MVRSIAAHQGGIRRAVHRLKYSAHHPIVDHLARVVVAALPVGTQTLVPVPRVTLRRWRFGVDPARALVRAAARLGGLSVLEVLYPQWWTRARAGPAGQGRGDPIYRLRRPVPPMAVLVDDVVTTGLTLCSAASVARGVIGAVTLTRAAIRP